MKRLPVFDFMVVADQPTAEEIENLKAEGFVAVVNLRREGEPDQPFSPAEEATLVGSRGLDYLHIGVGGAALSTADVNAVCEFLDRHSDGKVLLHCKMGQRAAALALVYLARRNSWSSMEALSQGRSLGLELPPVLQLLVSEFLNNKQLGA